MWLINFILLILAFTLSSSTYYWQAEPAKDYDKKYAALVVRRYYDQELKHDVEKFCMGVVLNDRYVLSIPECGNDMTKVLLGFTFFYENIRDREVFITSDGITYDVEERNIILPSMHDDSHKDSVLLLIRTKNQIKMDSHISCLSLPRGLLWQHLNPIGSVSSLFFRQMYSDAELGLVKYSLYTLSGTRQCSFNIIKDIPIWKLSSCIQYEPKTEAWLKEDKTVGLPLVKDNTVVGIKNYGGLSNMKYEIYVNLALYARTVELHMRGYTPCPV